MKFNYFIYWGQPEYLQSVFQHIHKQYLMKTVGKKHYKQYVLKQIIGTGSFGKVYSSPPYAIKQMCFQGMAPYLVKALKNQIQILKQIQHKNIVKLIDHFYEGPNVYLVMEYCEMDLSKHLKKNNKKLPEDKAIEILRQILMGFRELVKNQVIHRDLKPANILVNSKGEFKLADFGFAKFVNHYDSKLMYSIVGTPLYMAPQILAKKEYTTKCDIWSIGFIFYEMLTGTYPWMGVSQSDLHKNITTRPLNIPNNLSNFSKIVISKMLTVNQKERISWDQLFQQFLNIQLIKKQPIGTMPRIDLFGGKQNKKIGQQTPRTQQTPRGQQTPRDQQTPRGTAQQIPQQTPRGSQKKISQEALNKPLQFNQQKPKQKKIFTNKNLNIHPEQSPPNRAKSQKKLSQENKGVDYMMCYQNVFTDLIQIELDRLYDEQTALRISRNLSGKMDAGDLNKFQKALLHFNQQFQLHAKKIWKLQR